MQLADDAGLGGRRLARDGGADGSSALKAGSALSGAVQRLDDALDVQEAAFGDPGDGRRLGGKIAGRAGRRGRSRRARSRASRRRRCGAPPRRGSAGARCGARSARPRSARGASRSCRRRGAGSACRSRRSPRPTRASSTRRRSCWSRVSRPFISRRAGQGERHVLEPEAGDLLDHVDLARHVAGAPGRGDDLAVAAVEAEARRGSRTGARAASRCRSPRRRARGGSAITGRSGSVALHVARSRPGAAGGLEQELRRDVGGRARRGRGRRPSPSGSSPRCGASGARRCG